MASGLRRIAAALVFWGLIAGRVFAQADDGLTTLVADTVRIEGEDLLVAEGNVEVFARGTRLRADRLVYDARTERLTVQGAIRLEDEDGTILLADDAELDRGLENGIIQGARVILDERLQIASAEAIRRDGRFLDSRRVTASSCRVCLPGQQPLWEIRAERVIHDEEAAQVFFYNARFRIAGIPVFYLPTLRVPDGTQDRVRGFLPPRLIYTSDFGNGIEIPYFIPIGDHADLTFTPYIAERYSRTLGARYRQAFVSGIIEANGAVSTDSLEPDQTRGYFFLTGLFSAPRDFNLSFGVQTTSDDAYLRDYEISNEDRLRNFIGTNRVRENERIEADLTYFTSLRADLDVTEEPSLIADARYERRLQPATIGGWLDLSLIANGFEREARTNISGRDTAQIRGTAAWHRRWTGPAGIRFGGDAALNIDFKQIGDDDRFDVSQAALTPEGSATLSWPLSRAGTKAFYLIEPVAQFAWTAPDTLDSPNDDSTEVEFGSGNLFSQNRFPGLDRYEQGGRANVALRWSRTAPEGISYGLTGGRVYRFSEFDQFDPGTGLAGRESDWLAQIDIDFANNIAFRNLTLIGDDLDATRSETRLLLQAFGAVLTSSYIWQSEESREDFDGNVSELAATASYALRDTWFANAAVRQDLEIRRTTYSEVGLGYQNECVRVDLSVIQRFRATSDTEPVTRYGLGVTLAGLGSDAAMRRRRCTNGG